MQLNPASPVVVLGAGLATLVLLGNLVALAYWVYRDASARNANGPLWWTLLAFSGLDCSSISSSGVTGTSLWGRGPAPTDLRRRG